MGIFGKTDKRTQQNSATVIAAGTCIIGGISTPGTVHIDGKFEGVILEADIITIGQTGEVIGDIKANNLIVNGLFDGKIDCNEVHVLSSGKVIGEIRYNELVIEEDGKFEGQGIRKSSNLKSRYSEIEQKINNIIVSPAPLRHGNN
ncbi:cell shape determination protein CcmA [Malaciobacter molluscorum LMG 25693]|uniref:Bactofilin domain-containing protein n=1 Tax=Malaciobacter molluscorum LMG 25693 TaxID=870501 RepID=A0A2G1DGI1_9BACT|nr:polymer-forming cytoskeletal protein [Malaciobacter molluscorum]AXX91468.1 bactofilin domain-containing protein [Malaciobacter molluscorum LMG 25693]PHO17554.1 cell shape determination protein CcmA [Malaciobacter molluscorum LMG 25693]RXJ93367.1 cell shape determination protein CcmA [Malaciobacter molluscorum]